MGPDKRDSREAGSEKYFRQKKAVPEELCRFHTQWLRKQPHTQMYAVDSCSFIRINACFETLHKTGI